MKAFLFGLIAGLVIGVAAVLLVSFASQYSPAVPAQPPLPGDETVVQVTVDEPYLGRQIASALAQTPEYGDPSLDLREPDLALVSVTGNLAGVSIRPTVWMRLAVENDAVQIEVVQIEAGGLNVPLGLVDPLVTRLEQTLEERINEMLARRLADTDLQLRRLTTTETTLVADFGAVTTTAVAEGHVEHARGR